jgi:hypothetical protein
MRAPQEAKNTIGSKVAVLKGSSRPVLLPGKFEPGEQRNETQ